MDTVHATISFHGVTGLKAKSYSYTAEYLRSDPKSDAYLVLQFTSESDPDGDSTVVTIHSFPLVLAGKLAKAINEVGWEEVQAAGGIDQRDPGPSRTGIFREHNCWKCKDGSQPCVNGSPTQCEYPHARND